MIRKLVLSALLLAATTTIGDGCFLMYEQVSGMNKICFYSCLSGTKAITVDALDFCPLTL